MTVRSAACVGLGIIGASWAVVFARHCAVVRLWDPSPAAIETARKEVEAAAAMTGDPAAVLDRLQWCESLEAAVADVDYVQESAPERKDLKRSLFRDLDRLTRPDAILASSTSEMVPSQFLDGLTGAHRMLVAHPLNPPHQVPAVELCPSAATDPEVLQAAKRFLSACAMAPFALDKEAPGFVMNRLQIAVIREALNLVEQGICSAEAVDIGMRDGLARRWAAIGPFSVNRLSTRGGWTHFLAEYQGTLRSIANDLRADFDFPAGLGERIDASMGGAPDAAAYAREAQARDRRLRAIDRALAAQNHDD